MKLFRSFELWFVLALILIGLLNSCSDNRIAGGGSTGSEAGNAITAKVLLNDENVALQALVRVRPVDYIAGDSTFKLDTLIELENGKFSLTNIPIGEYSLEVRAKSQAAVHTLHLISDKDSTDLGDIELNTTAQIKGKAPLKNNNSPQIYVSGLEFKTTASAEGDFTLDSLPSGKHKLFFNYPDSSFHTSINTKPADTLKLDLRDINSTKILLSDFEDNSIFHSYSYLTEGGYWYMQKSPGVNFIDKDHFGVPIVQDSSCGSCIHIKSNFDNTKGAPKWYDVGLHLGGPYQTYDFNGMDSVAFKIRGSGEIFFKLLVLDFLTMEFSTLVELDSTWQRVSFAIKDMDFVRYDIANDNNKEESNITAEYALKSIHALSFLSVTETEIWIDDLELIGPQVFIFSEL
ncbi:MAG: carboxypeptidase-like regulatory domain-containing protein [Fibrobacter sp.]|nr:carboxypeptidase-like regulatory domain-containing protein [Fibrobacter sp.]